MTIASVAASYRNRPLRRLLNVFVRPLARLGLAGKRTHVLTVVGRRSGKRYSTPLSLVFLDGERWLVAPYGEREWVKNARAAGWVELTRARKTERVQVEEVGPEQAAPVLRAYLRSTRVTAPFFDAKRSAPLEVFAAEAHLHPVFRVIARHLKTGMTTRDDESTLGDKYVSPPEPGFARREAHTREANSRTTDPGGGS